MSIEKLCNTCINAGRSVAATYAGVPFYAQLAVKVTALGAVAVLTYLSNRPIGGLPVQFPYGRVTTPAVTEQRPVTAILPRANEQDQSTDDERTVRLETARRDANDDLLVDDQGNVVYTPQEVTVVTTPASTRTQRQPVWTGFDEKATFAAKSFATLKSIGLLIAGGTAGYFVATKL